MTFLTAPLAWRRSPPTRPATPRTSGWCLRPCGTPWGQGGGAMESLETPEALIAQTRRKRAADEAVTPRLRELFARIDAMTAEVASDLKDVVGDLIAEAEHGGA